MSVNHNEDYHYRESKRLRDEVLLQAEALKGNPLRVRIDNGIRLEVEIRSLIYVRS